MRTVVVQVLAFFYPIYKEVVQRTVGNEFQCTQGVGYTFEVVALSVSEVVHRVSFPGSTRTVVRMFHHAIDNRVAEVHVGTCHVNFGTEHHGAFLYLAGIHLLEQFECFLDGAVTVRAFHTGLGRSAFLSGNLLGCLLVDICFAFFDEADGEVP